MGDILVLDAGRIVGADARLIESVELHVEESALTGESIPASKDAQTIFEPGTTLGDHKNMVYMSSVITAGRGTAVVTAIGTDTAVGRIAHILDTEPSVRTPLEERLEVLGKMLGKIALAICALIFLMGFFQGRDMADMFLIAVSLAVASIPEGLPAIVAVTLSIGVTQMSKKNAIIKRLPAVETLGSVDIICSDKTGTLTQNQMTVRELFFDGKKITLDDEVTLTPTLELLVEGMVLASDATYEDGTATGDPTEVALLRLADTLDIDRAALLVSTPRKDELPFDSDRKMMSTVVAGDDGMRIFTK